MANEKHDPWALLREARDQLVGVQGMGKATQTIARIDAALAEPLDSATPVVGWRPSDQRVFLDGVSLRVVLHTDGLWLWSVYWPLSHRTQQGQVATEAEAKSAANAAAKGNL
jgi:hypothetical protein